MSRFKSMIRPAASALALAVVAGLTLGPEAVTGRVDEALFASWRALGDRIANRELSAISRQLDRERQDAGRLEALRDGLAARVLSLKASRDQMADRPERGVTPLGVEPGHELARLDATIAMLRAAVARADRVLAGARGRLREHEGELIALGSEVDVRLAERALAEPVGDPSLWDRRLARARCFLRISALDGQGRDRCPERAGLP